LYIAPYLDEPINHYKINENIIGNINIKDIYKDFNQFCKFLYFFIFLRTDNYDDFIHYDNIINKVNKMIIIDLKTNVKSRGDVLELDINNVMPTFAIHPKDMSNPNGFIYTIETYFQHLYTNHYLKRM
jgi:hypothetical protein